MPKKSMKPATNSLSLLSRSLFVALLLLVVGVNNSTFAQTQPFTSSGTFTVPAGVTSIKVECWGGGGAGGQASTSSNGKGGGGGGSYASSILAVTSGNSYTVTVGAGGTAPNQTTASTSGGASSFAALVVAPGGIFGNNTTNLGTGGAGGTGGTGTIKFNGGNGGTGNTATSGGGGGGGSSATATGNGVNGGSANSTNGGAGGNGTDGDGGNGGNNNNPGLIGTAPGGGGGGRGDVGNASGYGARGQVIVSWITVSAITTETCIGGSTGTITATGAGGQAPYTYSSDGITYQASSTFSGLAAGTYKIYAKDNLGRISFTNVTVSTPALSTDDQNAAGTDSWIGHVYDGTNQGVAYNGNFTNYYGNYPKAEAFDETFGGDYTCFGFTSNSIARSIYTETFSVRYRMNSTKKGLYVVNVGSDDGGRLTVDGNLIYADWGDHGVNDHPNVLMSLTGNSSLLYDFYENGGGNRVYFQYPTQSLVLANNLTANLTQNICTGSTGTAISGDIYGALPAGITLSGTGYQWSYSTTPAGVRTNITGATGAIYTPDVSVAPFNAPGTYYIFRNAILSSTNNVAPNPYIATNESNVATLTVNALPTLSGASQAATVCAGSAATINLTGLLASSTSTVAYSINSVAQTAVTGVVANGSGAASFTSAALTAANNGQILQITGITTSATPNCNTAFTQNVTMSVNPTSIGGSVASDQTICSGTSPANLTLSGNTGAIVKWQKASDLAFTTPTDIAGTTTTLTGATIGSLSANTYFRAVIQSGTCAAANSAPVLISINPIPTLSGATQAATVCAGSAATINLSGLLASSTSTVAYSINGVAQTAVTGVVANGSGAASFTSAVLTAANNGQTLQIMGITTTSATPNCNKAFTQNVTMSVNLATAISSQSTGAQSQCIGGTFTSISVTATGVGLSYQWYSNTIANTTGGTSLGSGNGAQTNSYTPQATIAGTLYYYCIVTGTCGSATSVISGAFLVNPVIGNNSIDFTNGLHGTICGTVPENDTAVLTAPSGTVFINVGFASYGTPTGTCPTFTLGGCHALTSQSVTGGYLLGNNTARIPATNIVFGDPCVGTVKNLDVLATYTAPICSGNTPGTINGGLPTGGNGIFTYLWESSTTSSSSGFASATGTNNTRNYTPGVLTQTIWYRRTVTSGGCTNISTVIQITVTPIPTATISYAGSPFCTSVSSPQSVTLSGTGAYTGGTYSSTAGLTINSGTGAITPSTSTVGTYTVTYTIPASGGCTSVPVTTSVTINPTPAITAMTSTVCSGVGFTVTPVNGTNGLVPSGTTYSWAVPGVTGGITGGATGSGAANISGTLTNPTGTPQTATYTVTPTSGSCTGATFTVTVTVNPFPIATYTLTATPSTIYNGSSSTLSLSGSQVGVNYQLRIVTTPVGSAIPGTGSAISFAPVSPSSTTTYNVLATNATTGCSIQQTSTATVTVIAACITSQPSSVTICSGAGTSFSVVASGSPSYQWQVSTNNGGSWNNIVSNVVAVNQEPLYVGWLTSTLSLTAVAATLPDLPVATVPSINGYQYRCVLSVGCGQTSNPATLNLQIINISYTLSANPGLVDVSGSSTLTLSGSQVGVNYQLRRGSTPLGSPVAGTGSAISFATVNPTTSTQYNVLATTTSGGCSAQITDTKNVIVNETGIIISLLTCNGQPGLNFFTNSEFGTTTTNNYQIPDQALFPGVTLGWPLGAYTNYTYGFNSSNAIPDGNYVIANSTAGMYRTPQQVMSRDIWLFTYDRSLPLNNGTGDMYIVNASNAPGIFYTEILSNLCENTRYEFRSEMINLYDANWVPHGPDYLNYFPSDGQGNYYSILPNVDFMLDGKVALNTGNIMNDAAWKTFGFTFRTATGQDSVTLTMRNNSTGGIGNDIALDNIIMRACGPEISLIINTTLPVCPGIPVTMTAHLIASDYLTPEFQWQKSTDNGVTWNNISGANDSIYTSTNPAYGDEFRFIVAETTASLSNPNCSVASNPVSITTTAGITGTTPGSVCGTGTVTLGATANSGSTINWYANLTGGSSLGTGTSFTTPTISSTTTYYVEATNAGCMSNPRTSVVATVNTSVTASISISASTGNSICSGTNVTFTATPTNGGATPSYQWKLNGGNVGTNSPTYSNNTLANGNTISCVMTSSISGCITGSPATSNTITMTVGSSVAASVSISANPGSTICQGTSVTFTAVATNGGATPNYQWKKNGTNIFGEVSNVYTTTTLVQGDIITCVMTTSLTCATGSPFTSAGITMTVYTVPVSPTLSAASPANGSTICAAFNTGTVTGAAGSGGSTGAADEYQYSINGGSTYSAYTSGNAITTTGATGSVIVQARRTGGGTGCSNTAWNTICTWTVGSTPTAPTLSSASPANGSIICAGFNTGTVTGTGGSGGSTGAANEYQLSINGGSTYGAYTNGAAITTTSANGNIIVQARRTGGSYGCTTTGWSTICTWTLGTTPTAPTLSSASPANGSIICAGFNTGTVTGTGGSGGSTGAANEYQVSINGGSTYGAYTNGAAITTTSATGNIIVQARRTGGSYGCTTTGWSTICTWTLGTTPTAPTLSSASPANGSIICAGFNTGTVTGTGGSGGSTSAANEYQVSINGGNTYSAYTNGAAITTTGATTSVIVQSRRTGGSYGCTNSAWSTICTWTIGSTPTAPTLSSASPANGSIICAGFNTGTVTGTGGSGGSTGAANEYQYSINGGNTYNTYTNGAAITTTGATTSVIVQSRRTGGSYGCTTTGWSTICTWTLGTTPTAPTLSSASPANGSTICAGFNTGTVTGTGGSGGSTGAANEYQLSINGGSTYGAYTNGAAITTTSATGNIIVQARRTGGSYGCTTTGWNTICTWTLGTTPTAPTLSSASPANGSTICAGFNTGTVTGTGGSGGSTGAANEYQYSINGGSTYNTYTNGSAITTTGATTSVIVQARRTGGNYGCSNSAWSTICTWTVTPTVGTPTVITISAGTEPTCQLTNGTTTTTYATTATNNTGFNWSLSNGSAGSIGATTGIMTWTNGFSGTVDIQVTASGCNGPSSQVTRTVNITPTVGTPTAITISTGTEPTCQLTNGTTTTTYATTATNNTGFNWSLSNGSAGSIDATTGVMTWADGFSGSVNIQVTASGCNGPSSQVIRTVTITPTIGTPTAITISAGTEPTCQLTNGTTTTTYATTTANNTGFNWSLSNGSAGSIGATTGIMTWANGFSGTVNIQVTASGCNGPSSQVTRTVTITSTVGTPTAITVSAGTEPTCQLTNGTTTTTYATTATNNTGYNWSLSNGSAGSIGATTGVMTWANGFSGTVNIQVTASGCNGPSVQVIRTVNVNPLPTASAGGSQTICSNATATVSGATSSNGTILWTHNGAGSITAGSTTLTPTYTAAAGDAGNTVTLTMTVTSNNACSPQTATATYTVDVNPLPTASAGGIQTICSNITATVSGASSSNGTILWTHNGAGSLSNATTLTPTYTPAIGDGGNTVTLTMTVTTIACASPITATATYSVNVKLEGSWSGSYIANNTDWNQTGNWDCNQLPSLTSDVIIATGVTNKHPVLSPGSDGTCRNLTIDTGASVTVSGNTLQIAGTITNNGTFTATNGTIEMKGSSAQTIPASTFSTNTLLNLTVNNASGVTLGGLLNITGILKALTGNLASGGNLTLVSTAAQTALIDGSGTGQVLGNVTMQRYLPSAFGYKYFSSPFQGATVNEFADDIDLTATFPTFYRYDEDNHVDTSGVHVYESGWVKYITLTNTLVPLQGYAANFGSVLDPKTADMTGVVNNGSFAPLSLMNHNRTYTQGFNLVGNPYPSPVDWDVSSGWTRLNIDNAIYYFNAGVTSEYTGSYYSYINGQSSGGGASNIIPAMQSFFVHVSDGTAFYPQTGALTFTNPVRINNLNPIFHKVTSEEIPLLRFTAGFEDSPGNEDAMVVYFNDAASWKFDKEYDALKLMNTDWQVPNIYSVSSDASKLSVNALPTLVDSINIIPVGLKTEKDGWISFHAREIKNFPTNLYIYFSDSRSGMCQNLLLNKDARINLKSGLYENRFSLIFSLKDFQYKPGADENFYAYSFEGTLYVYTRLEPGEKGTLSLYNILGQPVYHSDLFINGFQQIKTDLKPGIYVISLSSSKGIYLKKVFISNL